MAEPKNTRSEIVTLQAKTRNMEHDIKQYTEEIQKRIRKQGAEIQKLKKDNAALREDITNLQKIREPRPTTKGSNAIESVENY